MPSRRDSNTKTYNGSDTGGEGSAFLTVLNDAGMQTQVLPRSGKLTIGRAPDCAIVIDDATLSRYHVTLWIFDGDFAIEDLDSHNGTKIGDALLAPRQRVQIPLGASFTIGSTTLLLQSTPSAVQARRVLSHGQLELYLDAEFARAADGGAVFSLARIELDTQALGEDDEQSAVEQQIAHNLRRKDLLATYAPGVYEILFLGSDRAAATALLDPVLRALSKKPLRHAIASFPADGRSAGELIDALQRGEKGKERGDDSMVRSTLDGASFAVRRIAASDINVLILGETGVGKEIVARSIHDLSPRSKKRLLSLNCAAFSESLLDSELFGHERGAFTGAQGKKEGLLESADGGTVFLDEIGEMPLSVQAKLLRVVELKQVQRLGAMRPRDIDVRFVAATNRDLEAEVVAGRFRQDLLFRLNGISLVVSPLRDRVAEIEPLAELFLQRVAERMSFPRVPVLSAEAREALRAYRWPGNVRELRNVIERAAVLSVDGTITPRELPLDKMATKTVGAASASPAKAFDRRATSSRATSKSVERQQIVDALAEANGNQAQAARALGISLRTLINRMDEYALPRPRRG